MTDSNAKKRKGATGTAADISALPVIKRAPEKVDPPGCDSSPSIASGEAAPLPKGTAQGDTPAQQSVDEIIRQLATLKPLEYEKVRREQAKALGFRPAILDEAVKAIRFEECEADRLPFPEVEPHPDPINPAELLSEVSDTIQRFIVLDVEQAHAAALWIAFTWFADVVEVAPLAIITAPEKACGKSQLLALMGLMVSKPLPASSSTAAGLFRAVELWKPTVLIDEADTFIRENEELKGLINAGHTRGNAYVLRVVGDSHEPRLFTVWGAKAFAGIALEKHLSDATMSRAIVFELRRKLTHESVSRLRHANANLFEGIAAKLARFAADYSQQVRLARPILPEALGDRAQDNWEPLLAIAMCAGDEWLTRATAAALKLSGAGDKTVSTGNELLADIQHVFESKRVDKISTADLITALISDDEKSWATYNRGRPISAKQISNRLAGYGIRSKNMRVVGHGVCRGFEISQFENTFARYLADNPLSSATPLQTNTDAALSVAAIKSITATQTPSATTESTPLLDCNSVAGEKPNFESAAISHQNPNPLHLRI